MEKIIDEAKHYWRDHKKVVAVVAVIIVLAILF